MGARFTGGSVMNSGNWTMLVNDAWLLGGVHSHTQCQLASARTMGTVYNVAGAFMGQMTVTGRVGLNLPCRSCAGVSAPQATPLDALGRQRAQCPRACRARRPS